MVSGHKCSYESLRKKRGWFGYRDLDIFELERIRVRFMNNGF